MAEYIDIATFVSAGEVAMGDPVQTFRHEITGVSTQSPVFTHPDGIGTVRVEFTSTVNAHYACGLNPTADATDVDSGTRKATADTTFYIWAKNGYRIAVRTEQA